MKVGDKVKFLSDVGGGKITKILDKKMALVLNDDDFEIPVLISELLLTEDENDFFSVAKTPESSQRTETKIVEVVKEIDYFGEEDEAYEKENEEIELLFAFVPANKKDLTTSELDLYIINDSNWNLMYMYQLQEKNQYQSFPGKLSPNMKEFLTTIKRSELDNYRTITFQGFVYQKDSHDFREPIYKKLNINPHNFFKDKTFTTNDFFEQKAFILPVYQENLMVDAIERLTESKLHQVIETKTQNKNINKPKQFKKQEKNLLVEIDLHIHELIDDETGLSAKDKLEIQMNKFKEELHKAATNPKVKKIVFIHGKGEGVLKNEIRSELKRSYKQLTFQDASFQKYGFGATLVHV